MIRIVAVYGSPRRKGNTSLLLKKAVQGARETGAEVEEVVLRDLEISPCLEIYGCKVTGRCVIQDDFQRVLDQIQASEGIMLASPIFFYAVSAHAKMLIDRCQSLWVKKYWIEKTRMDRRAPKRKGLFISVGATNGKRLFEGTLLSVRYFFDVLDMTKYWIDKVPYGQRKPERKGLFISVGATKGKKLFDGALLTIKYFFDVLDTELWKALLHRGLDFEGDVLKHPEFLEEAYIAGKEICQSIEMMQK